MVVSAARFATMQFSCYGSAGRLRLPPRRQQFYATTTARRFQNKTRSSDRLYGEVLRKVHRALPAHLFADLAGACFLRVEAVASLCGGLSRWVLSGHQPFINLLRAMSSALSRTRPSGIAW